MALTGAWGKEIGSLRRMMDRSWDLRAERAARASAWFDAMSAGKGIVLRL